LKIESMDKKLKTEEGGNRVRNVTESRKRDEGLKEE
jgi:hypothetical protein